MSSVGMEPDHLRQEMYQSRTPLGLFGRLPPELRFMIWDYFYPRGEEKDKTDFTILRTSSTIHDEIIDYLKWPESLGHFEICICPEPEPRYSLRIYNAAHTVCWRIPAKWFSESAGIPGFQHWPIDRLDTVLSIKPPRGSEDPGEAIYLWERCFTLVNLFNFVQRPVKCLILTLDDIEDTTWIRRSGSHNQPDNVYAVRSLPSDRDAVDEDFRTDDIKMVISPFFGIHRIIDVQITMGQTSSNYAQAAGCISQLQTRLDRDMENILKDSSWKIAFYQSRLSLHFILSQAALDVSDGPMSHHLRLKRFIDWSQEPALYQKKIFEMISRCRTEIQQNRLSALVTESLWTRFGLMRLADPGFHGGRFPTVMHQIEYGAAEQMTRSVAAEFLYGHESRSDAWYRAFPAGVPMFDSDWWGLRKAWLYQIGSILYDEHLLMQDHFWQALADITL